MKVAEGKKRVDTLLEGLEEAGVTSKDFVVFSVATDQLWSTVPIFAPKISST